MSNCEKTTVEKHLHDLFCRFPVLQPLRTSLYEAIELLLKVLRGQGTIYLCGNGGSAADAEHIVGELRKGFLLPRPLPAAERRKFLSASPEEDGDGDGSILADHLQRGLRAVSLVSSFSLNTAVANDRHPELVFAQALYSLAAPHDALVAISTSGMARNVELAARTAHATGIAVVGMTGESGGNLQPWCDVCLRVPERHTPRIQELHVPLYHTLCAALEEVVFGEKKHSAQSVILP